MFKFWYEKFLFRFSFMVAFIAFLGVFVYAYITEVTIKPPEGNMAPFAQTLVAKGTNSLLPEERSLPLESPHLTDKELKVWSSRAISEALTLSKAKYIITQRDIRPYFTVSGLKQYQDYLKSSGIEKSVKDNSFTLSVFVEQPPLLLNGSSIKGIYRWLYQVPVTISFLPVGSGGYDRGAEVTNRKLNVTVQMRRVRLDDNPNAIQIESWAVAPRK
ncbi:MAG: DotI/IcmL family type IV secretion protein [Alphaproteobacteria bacterium]|nr:DotI/IcmL family type IV secretion protein [Alphaproteobacteria bacterium]